MAYVRLDCITLDRNLWLVSGNNGLGYPDIDMGQNPPTPSELVYINNIYPPQSNILVGQLWTQTTNILPIQGNYEPIPPTPSEPIYIEIPIQLSKILANRNSRTSFDSFTVADWIWCAEYVQPQPSPTSRKILPITYPAKYPMTYPN